MTDSELDSNIEWIAREAKRPVAVSPDAMARLLTAVRAEPTPARSSTDWSAANSRGVLMTPMRFAALAAGLVGIGVLLGMGTKIGRGGPETGRPTDVAANAPRPSASSPDTMLTFVIVAPSAAKVSMVGDFNQWSTDSTPMKRIGNSNAWSVTVPMSVGRHLYSFLSVDPTGEHWIADPHAPAAPDDGFGRVNSVILVGKGSTL